MTSEPFRYPEVDFRTHPYYAPFASQIDEAERRASLAQFLAVYSRVVAQQNAIAQHLSGRSGQAVDSAPVRELADTGILTLRLGGADLEAIDRFVAPSRAQLAEKRAATIPERRGVGAASLQVCSAEEPSETYAFFQDLMQRYGVFELCKAHKQIAYALKFVMLQQNTSEDLGLLSVCSFEDHSIAKSFYTHIDSPVDGMKVIIYLTRDVVAERGAFRYFPGAYRAASLVDLAIRKANDKCGWENVSKPKHRRAFAALPPEFQKKCNFGNDLLDDASADQVLRHERIYESSGGDLLLFDPDGAHRGAIFSEPGERTILQFSLVPDLSGAS